MSSFIYSEDLKEIIDNVELVSKHLQKYEKKVKPSSESLSSLENKYEKVLETLAVLYVINRTTYKIPQIKTKNPQYLPFFMNIGKQTTFVFINKMIEILEKQKRDLAKELTDKLKGRRLAIDEENYRKLLHGESDVIGITTVTLKENHVQNAIKLIDDKYKVDKLYQEKILELYSMEDNPTLLLMKLIDFVNENLKSSLSEEKNAIIIKLNTEFHEQVKREQLENKKEENISETQNQKTSPKVEKKENPKVQTPAVPPKTPNIDESKKYEEYAKIRAIFNELQELRKQYSNDEDFHNIVVTKFSKVPQVSGTTYEEIVANIKELREQLKVTTQIRQIIAEVEVDYEGSEDKYKIMDDGLTNLENRLAGRFSSILHEEISPELRTELQYCIKTIEKVAAIIKNNKLSWSRDGQEEYEKKILEVKREYYVNTILYDVLELNNLEVRMSF